MRVMLPREHGVYGQMIFPLATALLVGRAAVPAFALTGAGLFAFLAHEPLLVILGRRGRRAAADRGLAWRLLVLSVVLALLSAAVAIVRMPSEWRSTLLAPAVFAASVGIVIALNRERTIGGEILTALAFSVLACPTALAAGSTLDAALTCTAAFAASFVAATVSVRAVIAGTRRPPATRTRVTGAISVLFMLGLLVWLVEIGWIRVLGVWAAVPGCGAALAMVVWTPQAVHLRTVGWTLVIASAATMLVLVFGLR